MTIKNTTPQTNEPVDPNDKDEQAHDPVENEEEPHYYCRECGSANVRHAMWVNYNTEEVGDVFGSWNEDDAAACVDCDSPGCIISRDDPEFEEWARENGVLPPKTIGMTDVSLAEVIALLSKANASIQKAMFNDPSPRDAFGHIADAAAYLKDAREIASDWVDWENEPDEEEGESNGSR